jgi:uncharacterized membrane protein YhaH (DUF805 family)
MAVIGNWRPVVLERYKKFDGRAGREEFWFFVLDNIAVYFALLILGPVSLIPIVGGIIVLVFFATPGTEGPNQFGVAAEPAAA